MKGKSGTDKLNSLSENSGPIGIGGLLRGFTKKWLKGFIISIGVSTDTTAKFWEILKGLELGFRSLLLESNSQNCMHLIKHATTQDPHFYLVPNVQILMDMQ